MIRVGTLCLLLDSHQYDGRVCTVVGPIGRATMRCEDSGSTLGECMAYPIEIPGVAPLPSGRRRGARACDLRPLNDPDNAPAVDRKRKSGDVYVGGVHVGALVGTIKVGP